MLGLSFNLIPFTLSHNKSEQVIKQIKKIMEIIELFKKSF